MKIKGILILILILLTACQEKIIHDLSEVDANRLISKLYAANLEPLKKKQPDGKWSISVPERHSITAIQLLEDHRFFKKESIQVSKSKLISSNLDQQISYENILSEQLEHTLHSLSGVFEAHVHLKLPLKSGPWDFVEDGQQSSSAAVLLIVERLFNFSEDEIKKIVSGASGISQEHVSVVVNYPPVLTEAPMLPVESKIMISTSNFHLGTEDVIRIAVAFLSLLLVFLIVYINFAKRKKKSIRLATIT